MDFGKVETRALQYVDFTLPPDGMHTEKTLSGFTPAEDPKFYVGCSRWGRKEWLGSLYPVRTKEAYFLDEYAKHFSTIELNAVFYSIPYEGLLAKWRRKIEEHAPHPGFLFLPKASRVITHMKRLKNVQEELAEFMLRMEELGPYLGPILFQLGDNFGPTNFLTLKEFIESLPADKKFFMEFRHEDWFSNPIARLQLFNLLAEHHIGSVITDASGRRDCVHMELSTKEVMIRFVGNGGENAHSDYERVDAWVARLKEWLDSGLEKVYFIAHRHDEKDTYLLAKYVIEQFNKHLGAHIPEIILQP